MALYTAIEDINDLLADILATFPTTIYIRDGETKGLQEQVILPLGNRSTGFCLRWFSDSADRLAMTDTSSGANGTTGPFTFRGARLYANVISYIGTTWLPYYMQVYAKTTRFSEQLELFSLRVTRKANIIIYIASNVVLEATMGALVSHLFDIGCAPSLLKYFGLYACNQEAPDRGTSILLFERASLEFSGLLANPDISSTFLATVPADYMIWVTQLAHSLYLMKRQFGMVHGDLHLRNILFSYVSDKFFKLTTELLDIKYATQDLASVSYYNYKLPFKVNSEVASILLENNGLLPKIIDFGVAYADFTRSTENRDIPIIIAGEEAFYKQVYMAWEACTDSTKYGDNEVNFIILNLVWQFYRLANTSLITTDHSVQAHANYLLTELLPFFQSVIGSTFNLAAMLSGDSEPMITGTTRDGRVTVTPFFRLYDPKAWFMSVRNVGTTSDITKPLKNIWLYIALRSKEPVTATSASITRSGNKPTTVIDIPFTANPKFNIMNTYLNSSLAYWRNCVLNSTEVQRNKYAKSLGLNPKVGKEVLCASGRMKLDKVSPLAQLIMPFYNISNDPELWQKDSITEANLAAYLRYSIITAGEAAVRVYSVRLPGGMVDFLRYREYNRNTLFQPIPKALVNTPLVTTVFHLLYLSNRVVPTIRVERADLYSIALRVPSPRAMVINASFFVVKGNVNNPLTPGLGDKLGYPIGYFYNAAKDQRQFNGTTVPIPKTYENNFATIYIDATGMHLMKSVDFMALHESTQRTVKYRLLKNNEIYTSQRKVIKMQNGKPVMKGNFKYTNAFETGPILIWDGKIVFTTPMMLETEMLLDLTTGEDVNSSGRTGEPYALTLTAENNKKFYNEPGENNFVYGQRASNSLNIHCVLCQLFNGSYMYLMVEGRGFTAPGVDKAELAKLITKFNVQHAVGLDGGFSAGAVFKEADNIKWLLPDPDKRAVSTAFIFKYS